MAIKYQQTWGWSLININHVGIWIWHIDLLHDHRYTSHWRIIKPNSFWMLSYSSFFFLKLSKILRNISYPQKLHVSCHVLFICCIVSYLSTRAAYFESLKFEKTTTSKCTSIHTKYTLLSMFLATVLSAADDWKMRVLNNLYKDLFHIL